LLNNLTIFLTESGVSSQAIIFSSPIVIGLNSNNERISGKTIAVSPK